MPLIHLKKFISSSFKFAVAFGLVYLLLLVVLCEVKLSGKPLVFRACQGLVWKGGYTYDRFKEFDPNHVYDILVFGSSRANRGINPKNFDAFGYRAYNLSTDDQTPINTEVLVREYVKPHYCRLVIIDLYDKVFAQPDLESTSDLIQNVSEHTAALRMAYKSKDVRSLNSFCVRMLLRNKAPLYEAETDLYKGFRGLKKDSVSFKSNHTPYKSILRNIESLNRTLSYLKSINMPVLLVSQPMIFYKRMANHQLFLKDIESVIKQNNVRFYNFTNDASVLSIDDYADECHLSIIGANKYSEFLLKEVIAKNIKPRNSLLPLVNN